MEPVANLVRGGLSYTSVLCGRVIAERACDSHSRAGLCFSEAIVSPCFSVAKVALSLCEYVVHSLEDGPSMIRCRTLLLAL